MSYCVNPEDWTRNPFIKILTQLWNVYPLYFGLKTFCMNHSTIYYFQILHKLSITHNNVSFLPQKLTNMLVSWAQDVWKLETVISWHILSVSGLDGFSKMLANRKRKNNFKNPKKNTSLWARYTIQDKMMFLSLNN